MSTLSRTLRQSSRTGFWNTIPRFVCGPATGSAADLHATPGGDGKARNEPEESALAATRRADDGDEFPFADPKVHFVDGIGVDAATAERLADGVDGDMRRGFRGRLLVNQPQIGRPGSARPTLTGAGTRWYRRRLPASPSSGRDTR